MRELRRGAVILGLVAVGIVAGCGSEKDCNQTPDLAAAPSSCTLPADTNVTVNVRWCSCGASTTCDVSFDAGSGIFQLEPKVSSCDASCPSNTSSCPTDTVPCTFKTPASGSGYALYVINGINQPKTVSVSLGGSNPTCGG